MTLLICWSKPWATMAMWLKRMRHWTHRRWADIEVPKNLTEILTWIPTCLSSTLWIHSEVSFRKFPSVTLFVGWRLTNFIGTESFWKTIFWWIFLTENLLSNIPDYNPSYYKQLYYPSYGYGKQSYNYGKLIHDFISPFHIFNYCFYQFATLIFFFYRIWL